MGSARFVPCAGQLAKVASDDKKGGKGKNRSGGVPTSGVGQDSDMLDKKAPAKLEDYVDADEGS